MTAQRKSFDPDEIDKLIDIAWEQRARIVERVLAVFPAEDKGAEAVGYVLGLLTASAFSTDPEQQHGEAECLNELFAAWHYRIGWHLTPIGSDL